MQWRKRGLRISHTTDCATPLLLDWHRRGVDLYKISKLLGHKDIKTTQRYAHHCPDSLRDGVEILETDYVLTTVGVKNGNFK